MKTVLLTSAILASQIPVAFAHLGSHTLTKKLKGVTGLRLKPALRVKPAASFAEIKATLLSPSPEPSKA
jgi:hypothetical protein